MRKVGLGIIEKEGEVLIVKREKVEKGNDGSFLTWAFPGGKVEEESVQEAAKREVFEETGYEVEIKGLICKREFEEFQVRLYYYSCRIVRQQNNADFDGVTAVKWVKPSELIDYFTSELAPGLVKYFRLS